MREKLQHICDIMTEYSTTLNPKKLQGCEKRNAIYHPVSFLSFIQCMFCGLTWGCFTNISIKSEHTVQWGLIKRTRTTTLKQHISRGTAPPLY